MLQRVLLAYARWNNKVGYCQGFNVIAAVILDVMQRQEDCALKVDLPSGRLKWKFRGGKLTFRFRPPLGGQSDFRFCIAV